MLIYKYLFYNILESVESVLNISISYTKHDDHLLRGMAIKLVGTFIEVILKNNFGEFKVKNSDLGLPNVLVSDLINIIAQVYFIIIRYICH